MFGILMICICILNTSNSYSVYTLVQPPLPLVQSLIAANPEAVTTKNHYGMIPLRTAIRSQASTEVIGK